MFASSETKVTTLFSGEDMRVMRGIIIIQWFWCGNAHTSERPVGGCRYLKNYMYLGIFQNLTQTIRQMAV